VLGDYRESWVAMELAGWLWRWLGGNGESWVASAIVGGVRSELCG
jgi:hypothetical protein